MAANKKIRWLIAALFLIFTHSRGYTQPSLLNLKVSISVSNQTIENTLSLIGKTGNFSFSYNSDILPVDSVITFSATGKEVYRILNSILGDGYSYMTSGHYIIILKKKPEKKNTSAIPENTSYTISGYLIDSRTGQKIASATIYDLTRKESILTDENGFYSLTINAPKEYLGLEFSKNSYIDTVIFVKPTEKVLLDVRLIPKTEPASEPLQHITPKLPVVDSLPLVRSMVSEEMLAHSENMDMNEVRIGQVSFLPFAGTNSKMSGTVVNRFSLNVLAGYACGLEGIEIGGLANINRKNVNGIQIAGLGNITGQKTKGIQIAGFCNQNLGKVDGLQIAGFCNTVLDSIRGAQISGFSNIIKGSMKGIQISGFTNITTRDAEAVQISGFANITNGQCTGQQISGFSNISNGDNTGVQISGFANIVKGNCTGVQIAGFANISTHDTRGTQVSGFINVSDRVEGVQIGVFNVADTVSGVSIGVFNFIKKGYHSINVFYDEMMPVNAEFCFGTHHFYNIVGVAADPGSDHQTIGYTYGIGSVFFAKKKLNCNTEIAASQFTNGGSTQWELSQRYRFTAHLNYNFSHHIGIFAGPSFNLYLTNSTNTSMQNNVRELVSGTVRTSTSGNTTLQNWIGYQAGIKVRF